MLEMGSQRRKISGFLPLAHLVLGLSLGLSRGVRGLEAVLHLDVEVAAVLVVGADVELALDLLALGDGEDVLEVEDGLLPVRVLGVGAGREADGLVAGREVNVEPGDQGVDEVVAAAGQLEGHVEGQVGDGARVQVEREDGDGLRHGRLDFDSIDQGLGQSGLLEGGVVESVDVVPDCVSGMSAL